MTSNFKAQVDVTQTVIVWSSAINSFTILLLTSICKKEIFIFLHRTIISENEIFTPFLLTKVCEEGHFQQSWLQGSVSNSINIWQVSEEVTVTERHIVCTACSQLYKKLNKLYEDMEQETNRQVCMDVVDVVSVHLQ